VTSDQRTADLEAIAAEVRTCQRCRLARTRTQAVPGEGSADTEVVFVGEGPAKAELQTLRAKLDLDNVLMLPEQPRTSMPAVLSAADVALVPLRKVELFEHAVPSKLFDAWACGCPVLLSIDGEARRVLEAANGGLFVPPEDPTALARAINELALLPDRGRSLGANGRRFTEERYSRQAQARQLEQLLSSVIGIR